MSMRLEQFERYDGRGPLILLLLRNRVSRLGQEILVSSGRFPEKEFMVNKRYFRDVTLKIFWGIVPVRLFSAKFNLIRFWRLHVSLGMLPLMWFFSKENICNIEKLLMMGVYFQLSNYFQEVALQAFLNSQNLL